MNSHSETRSIHGWALEQTALRAARAARVASGADTAPAAGGVHRWARSVLLEAWPRVVSSAPTQRELDGIQAVAAFDGGYGRGYLKKTELQNAHNWGAIHCCLPNADGSCPSGSVQSSDYNAKTGKEYVVCFKSYPDDVAGAADVIRNLTTQRPKTWGSLRAGRSVQDWVRDMYIEKYFGGFHPPATEGEWNVSDYANNVWAQLQRIWAELGEAASFERGTSGRGPLVTTTAPAPSSGSGAGAAALGLAFFVGLVALRGRS